MADQTDDIIEIPVAEPTPGDGGSPVSKGEAMNESDYGLLKMAALNGAQRQSDGAGHYAENLRYDYLEGKSNVSLTEGLGVRYISGPHPQFGSPDAKP